MEAIVNIEKTKEDIERCLGIVKAETKVELSEDKMLALTKEIMDTCLFIGGDFSDDNIINISKQYKESGGIDRFLKKLGGQ